VKGPLYLIKPQWLNDDWVHDLKKQNLIDFVLNLRERVRDSLKAVNECAVNEKAKSTKYYDLKTRVVEFEEGDLVLVLLPLIGKPLQARYCGSYKVLQRFNEVDYVIAMLDRWKTKRVIHVNLLKKFISRDEVHVEPVAVSSSVTVSEPVSVNFISQVDSNHCVSSVNVSDVSLSHLNGDQQVQLHQLLVRFADVFSDVPGKTDLVQHTIRLKEGVLPVVQAPYWLNPDKLKIVDK